MGLEKMTCCGALTHVYSDIVRKHNPGCKYYKEETVNLPQVAPAPEGYVNLMGYPFYKGFLSAHPGIKEALETGQVEGVPFRLLDGEIEAGDTYIAERNTGLKLLTCRENVREQRFICPVEPGYAYNTGECIKIELILD